MQIATIPERPVGAVSRHAFTGFAGFVCLGVGYLALAALAWTIIIVVADLAEGKDVNVAAFVPVCAGLAIAGIVLVPTGLRVLRGRRRLVLFLRRFGLSTSTAAMTHAVSDGLGSRWRVVTLDDHAVAPVGVDRTPRRRLRWARYLTVVLALVVGGLVWVNLYSQLNSPDSSLNAFVAKMVATLLVVVFTAILVLFVVSVMVGLIVASWFARAADSSRRRAITSQEQINPTAKRLASAARHFFSARLVVLRVDNAVWPQVVERLIQLCDAVVVDISSPSPNLEWEIARLNAGGKPWVPLGQLDRLAALQQDASADAQNVRTLIGSRLVLAYRDNHPRALAQTLGAALNSTVA